MVLFSQDLTRANINKNFLIKWRNYDEKKFNLIGGGKYAELVGEELKTRHFEKVLESPNDVIVFKIRGKRIEVKFMSK